MIKLRLRRRHGKVIALSLLVAFAAVQFVPVRRTNPMGAGDPSAPREVQWILRRACYDCHSNESRWPIWAYIAPMSWRVVGDVEEARSVLNFSDWRAYPPDRRTALRAIVRPVTAGHRMPLWYYLTLHPDARLSEQDLAALAAWSDAATEELQTPTPADSTDQSK